MAEKIKSGKRKGAEASTIDAKASKKAKVENTSKAVKSQLPAVKASATTTTEEIAPRKSSRKRAADMFDAVEDAAVPEASKAAKSKSAKSTNAIEENAPQKTKKAKKETVTKLEAADEVKPSKKSKTSAIEKTTKETAVTKAKSAKASKKSVQAVEALEEAFDDFEGFESNDDDEAEIDTSQLLAGFESSDESGSDDGDQGIAINKLPRAPPANGAAVKDAENRRGKQYAAADEPCTLYIGHIPHGFYERQMHAYFSQFGTITRLRLARNRRTGKPKHYAFIEFASADVADIVQRTMDKYLLFDHILQVRKMAAEQVHEKMWKGSESRFKVIPWGAIQGRGLKAPRERTVWKKRVGREEKRREQRKAVADEYGYDFDMPGLKQVEDVKEKTKAVQDGGEVKAITAGDEAVDAFVEAGMPQDEVALKQKKTKRSASASGGTDALMKKEKKQKKNRVVSA